MFVLLAGPYQNISSVGEAFKIFVPNLEAIVKEYKEKFFTDQEPQKVPVHGKS